MGTMPFLRAGRQRRYQDTIMVTNRSRLAVFQRLSHFLIMKVIVGEFPRRFAAGSIWLLAPGGRDHRHALESSCEHLLTHSLR